MLGYSEAEMLGRCVWEFVGESDLSRRSVLDKIAGKASASRAFERSYRRRDGALLPVLIEEHPMLDQDGRVIGMRSTIRDITEQVRMEEDLRRSHRLTAVGELAGGIAHEFNNLLIGIQGYANLLRDPAERDSQAEHDLTGICNLCEGGADLTRQLLTFGRRREGEPEMFDLNVLVEATVGMLRRVLGEDIQLEFEPAPAPTTIHADRAQMEQVLMELAVNARDAMPGGGRLSIRTANVTHHLAHWQRGADLKPGPYVVLSAADTGCGMDEQILDRSFDPCFTTKDIGQGTGLGLATVYGTIRQHGGHIRVETAPGEGSTFVIRLPRRTEAVPDAAEAPEAPLPGGAETMLLVEDDPDTRAVTRRFLRRLGYTVFTAASPRAAEGVFRWRMDEIALLLTDVVMPGMTGLRLAKRLRARRPDLKVVYMSGYPPHVLEERAALEPDAAFLAKPFSLPDLARTVRETLDN